MRTKLPHKGKKIKSRLKKKKEIKIPENTIEWFKDVLGKCLQDTKYCIRVTQSNLTKDHLPRNYMKWTYDTVKKYIDNPKYGGKIPSLRVLKDKLENDTTVNKDFKVSYYSRIKDLYNRKVDSEEYSLEAIEKVIQKEEFKIILEEATKNIAQFKDPKIAINTLVNKSFKISSNKESFEIVDLFKEVHERQQFRKHVKANPHIFKKFHFRIPSIDACMPGGLIAPMMASVAAKTGIGKSILTVYGGDIATDQGFNVTHITSENENIQTTGRYDSRITQIKYDDIQLANLTEEDEKKFRIKFNKKSKSKSNIMIVKCNPNDFTAATVLHVLNILEAQGHKTEFLIIDSPDLMQPVNQVKDKRLQQSAIYWEVKSVLKEKNCIGLMTTQLKQGANDDNPLAEDLSESYDKARLLDFLMVISRNKTQKANNEATLAVVKNRDGKTQTEFTTISTHFEIMSFEEKPQEEDPEEIDDSPKKGKKGKFTVIEGGQSKQLDKLRTIGVHKKKKKIKGVVKPVHPATRKKIKKKVME